MSADLVLTDKDKDYLVVAEKLGNSGKLLLEIEDAQVYHSCGVALTEQQAMQLVCHIIKVFHVPETSIEVIWFEEGYSRADILRKAANRLDAAGTSNSQATGDCSNGWR